LLKFFGQNLGQLQKTKQDLKCPDYMQDTHLLCMFHNCFRGRDESNKWNVGSKHVTRSQKGCWMLNKISQNQIFIFLLLFKTIVIMAS
jgi:hypothetical protein